MRKYFLPSLVIFFLIGLFFQLMNTRSSERVKIYVKDRYTGRLVVQKTKIPSTETDNEKLQWVLNELISGPTGRHYEKIFNPDIDIQNVIIKERIAYISFGWKLIDTLQSEPVLAVRSIVNSVLANARGLKGVKILIEGIEPVSTFSNIPLSSTFSGPL